ncbi:MAG TPA: hypothetical protein VLV49_18055 [Terriglobales bacterium]|nr:hypothetical protein [Terriglobales bacterium]
MNELEEFSRPKEAEELPEVLLVELRLDRRGVILEWLSEAFPAAAEPASAAPEKAPAALRRLAAPEEARLPLALPARFALRVLACPIAPAPLEAAILLLEATLLVALAAAAVPLFRVIGWRFRPAFSPAELAALPLTCPPCFDAEAEVCAEV